MIEQSPGHYDTSLYGFRQFNASEKDVVRELTFERCVTFLNGTPTVYLGLETEQFLSLKKLADLADVDSGVIIEFDSRVAAAMESARRKGPLESRQMLNRLEVLRGDINTTICRMSVAVDARFNVVNLDYLGRLTKIKLKAISALFERELLADSAVIMVTLSDAPLELQRARHEGMTGDFYDTLTVHVRVAASPRYELTDKTEIRYGGGTNGSEGTPMRVCMFFLRRIEQTTEENPVSHGRDDI